METTWINNGLDRTSTAVIDVCKHEFEISRGAKETRDCIYVSKRDFAFSDIFNEKLLHECNGGFPDIYGYVNLVEENSYWVANDSTSFHYDGSKKKFPIDKVMISRGMIKGMYYENGYIKCDHNCVFLDHIFQEDEIFMIPENMIFPDSKFDTKSNPIFQSLIVDIKSARTSSRFLLTWDKLIELLLIYNENASTKNFILNGRILISDDGKDDLLPFVHILKSQAMVSVTFTPCDHYLKTKYANKIPYYVDYLFEKQNFIAIHW